MKISDLKPEQVKAYFQSWLPDAKFVDGNKQLVRCRFHQDRTPSLSLDFEKAAFNCFGCESSGGLIDFEQLCTGCDRETALDNIFQLIGLERPSSFFSQQPEAIYRYRDESGEAIYEKLRYPGKRFMLRRPGGDSGLGDCRRVLYRLPELVTSNVAIMTEGEKDADNVASLDLSRYDSKLVARVSSTTNVEGAGKWSPSYSPYFTGKDVIILPDNDDQGRRHAEMVATSIASYAHWIKIVELPDIPAKGDVSDYLVTRGARDLLAEVRKAPFWMPPKPRLIVPAPEFLSYIPEVVEWIVDGVIQRGSNGFIVSAPKVGKSWCATDLAVSLALGTQWMEFSVPNRVRTALISREDNPQLTGWRMKRLVNGKLYRVEDLDQWLYVNSKDQSKQFKLDNDSHLAEMMAALREVKPEFVILDVLNVMHSADENDNSEMRMVLDRADQIHKELDCGVCLIHHFNKQERGRLTERMRGSSAMAGWAEWIIGIEFASDSTDERVRRMEFELKAGSRDPIYWKISGESEESSSTIHRVDPPGIRPPGRGRVN